MTVLDPNNPLHAIEIQKAEEAIQKEEERLSKSSWKEELAIMLQENGESLADVIAHIWTKEQFNAKRPDFDTVLNVADEHGTCCIAWTHHYVYAFVEIEVEINDAGVTVTDHKLVAILRNPAKAH